jgi:hypothetical protein
VKLGHTNEQDALVEALLARRAVGAMWTWLPVVRGIPQWASTDERLDALCELVRWYERVCGETEYASAPPLCGLDALVDELTSAPPYEALQELGLARWALRVSEELVAWRANLAGGMEPRRMAVSAARLELALMTTNRNAEWISVGENN